MMSCRRSRIEHVSESTATAAALRSIPGLHYPTPLLPHPSIIKPLSPEQTSLTNTSPTTSTLTLLRRPISVDTKPGNGEQAQETMQIIDVHTPSSSFSVAHSCESSRRCLLSHIHRFLLCHRTIEPPQPLSS